MAERLDRLERQVPWGCRGGAAVCTVPPTATGGVTAIAANGHSLALSDPLEQTIAVTVHAPATAIDTQSFTVAASSSSGLPVTYSSSGVCSNSGATFTMTSPTGTCQVKYDQPGGGAYDAAPKVVESVEARPQPCTVPNVVGKKLRPAKRAIAQRHCRTGKVRSAYSAKRRKGIVVSQSRRAGKVLPTGSKIDLVVSRGRRR
jgi:PASTA domain